MLSLDEAIKHCEEVAEKHERHLKVYENMDEDRPLFKKEEIECRECVQDHRQLAEWLKELKRWREFGRKNVQFINDCLLNNQIDELFSSEIKDDADILRITNESLTLRTTNEFCKLFNEQFKRRESDSGGNSN